MSPMRHKGGLDITDTLTVSGSVATPTGTFSQSLTVSGVPVNIGAGGGGTSDHAALLNLDFASAGHTGFASEAELSAASGTLSTEIDTDIATHAADASAHHIRYSKDENDAIIAGTNVTVVSGANTITINSTGGGGGGTTANALVGSDGITVTSGDPTDDISGFRAEFVATSGSLQSQIDAVEASDVDSVNSVTGAVVIAGAGEVAVTTAGQTITISGTDHSGGGGGARTYTASNGGTDQTISGTLETAITGLGNIAVPGTPDGAKEYKLNCVVPFLAGEGSWGYSTKPQPEALTVVSGASMSSGADESLVLATSISAFCWWQPTDETETTDGAIFGAYQTGLDQNTIQLAYDKGTGEYVARVTHDLSTNAKKYHYTGLSQVIGEWIFIGFTYTSAVGLKLYVNGQEHEATQTENNTVSQTNNDDRHVVICQNELTGEAGAGSIHQLGFWAAILSAEEIADLYNAGHGDTVDFLKQRGSYKQNTIIRQYYRFGDRADPDIGISFTGNASLASDGTPAIDDADVNEIFFSTPRLIVHMGATGDLTDAVVYSTPAGQSPLALNGLQVTPASGDKITLGFRGNGGGNKIYLGEQIAGQFSFLEIEEI